MWKWRNIENISWISKNIRSIYRGKKAFKYYIKSRVMAWKHFKRRQYCEISYKKPDKRKRV